MTTGPSPTRQPRVMRGRVERGGHLAVRADRDQPAVVAPAAEPSIAIAHASCEAEAAVAQERVDLVRERRADDRLAVAGARDGDGRVVGPRAGADQRRVADAPEPLAGDAAGRGRGGEPAVGVARHGADRAARAGSASRCLSATARAARAR